MVDLSKHKDKTRPNRFGEVPAKADRTHNLDAPEIAPEGGGGDPEKIPRKKTGRTRPFSTRVSPEFDEEFREVAFSLKLKHVDLLEQAFAAFKAEKGLK